MTLLSPVAPMTATRVSRRILLAAAFVMLTMTGTVSHAVPITETFTINFNQAGGTGPAPTGGFTYNFATDQFTNFLVNFNGLVFDFTAISNTGFTNFRGGCAPSNTARGVYLFLVSANCIPLAYDAIYPYTLGGSILVIYEEIYGNSLALNLQLPPPGGQSTSHGIINVSSAVPEPTSIGMLTLGTAALALLRQRRSKTSGQNTPDQDR